MMTQQLKFSEKRNQKENLFNLMIFIIYMSLSAWGDKANNEEKDLYGAKNLIWRSW